MGIYKILYISYLSVAKSIFPFPSNFRFDILLEILKKSQEICFTKGATRVCTIAKFDNKIEGITIDEKVSKFRK